MKKLYVLAALLMVNTAAHAGNSISFEIGGHKIHVEAPKNCDSLSCLKVSAPGLSSSDFGFKDLKSKRFDDDGDVAQRTDPPAPKSAPAPINQAAATPQAPVATASNTPSTSITVASTSPASTARDNVAPPAPAVASAAAPQPAPVAAAPVAAPTTPLGVWATEENKGNVRVESCGENLCGYAVGSGEKILLNMKPSDKKWTGRIHDPDSGSTYDSTIVMKGPNTMRVQGCAFGGLFCGGQIWKRVS
jgi:uncharacterized protein (DUF2147 family)